MPDEVTQRRMDLRDTIQSPGGEWLISRMKEIRDNGWKKFIALPVAQKTSKESFNQQARYEVMQGLLEEIESEVQAI